MEFSLRVCVIMLFSKTQAKLIVAELKYKILPTLSNTMKSLIVRKC